MGDPFVEIAGRVDESTKAHIGVLDPAKFRALTPVFTRDVRIQRYLIDLAGDDVALSANRRHEEAVNDVLRNELEVDYQARRCGSRTRKWPSPMPRLRRPARSSRGS